MDRKSQQRDSNYEKEPNGNSRTEKKKTTKQKTHQYLK